MTLTEASRLLDSQIRWIDVLAFVIPAQTSVKEAPVTLWRGLQNCCGLKFRRYASVVSLAKSFLQFSVSTALSLLLRYPTHTARSLILRYAPYFLLQAQITDNLSVPR